MIALLKRFLKSIQFRGVLGHFFGNVVVRSVATVATAGAAGFAGAGLLWLAFMLLLGVVMLIVLMVRTPSPRRAKWCAEVVEPLVGSDEQYCLLLRPFGYDGRLVLPDIPASDPGLPWWKRPGAAGPVQRTKPIEQVIADSVRTALGVKTYSVVDQSMLFAPPGLEYLRAHNDSWHRPVHQMIARAHTLILWLPPDLPVGKGLDWEVATIARLGLQSRVIFVLPPAGSDRRSSCPASHRMFELTARLCQGAEASREDLRGRALGLLDRIDGDILLARVRTDGDPTTMVTRPAEPGSRRRIVHAASTYGAGLVELLTANRHERNELDLKARYAARHRPTPGPVNEQRAVEPSGPCLICGTAAAARSLTRSQQ